MRMLNKNSYQTLSRSRTLGDKGEHEMTFAYVVKKTSVLEQDQCRVSFCAFIFIMIGA